MRKFSVVLIGIAVLAFVAGCAGQRSGIAAVADAMGATNLNSIEYSGSGFVFGFGQAFAPWRPDLLCVARFRTLALRYSVRSRRSLMISWG